MKQLNYGFTINLKLKVIKPKRLPKKNRVSRRCLAVVIESDGILYAKTRMNNNEDCSDFYIVPFTDKSLQLKDKPCVFAKHRDKYGKRICFMRDSFTSKYSPGTTDQYDVLQKGLLISGYMIRIDGILYFEYEDLIAFTEKGAHINDITINEDEPIMKE